MAIYDVYEELEKPNEDEILFINNVLDGKVGFSSYEEVGYIFHKSNIIKNDNYDVIIDGGSCVNLASTYINDTSFESDLDVESIESDLIVLSKPVEMEEYNQVLSVVNTSFAEFGKVSPKFCQVQKGDLIAELCGCSLFYKDDASSSYRRARIEDGSDWKIRCKMKGEQNMCEWMVMPLIKFDVNYVKFNLEDDYLKDLRTSPKLEGENDAEMTMSYQQQIKDHGLVWITN